MKGFSISIRGSLLLLFVTHFSCVHCDEGKQGDIFFLQTLYLFYCVGLLLSGGLFNSSVVPMNFVELWSPDRQCRWEKKTGQKLMCKKTMQPGRPANPSGGAHNGLGKFQYSFWNKSISIQQLNFIEQSIHRSTTPWSPAEASMGLGQLHPVFSSRTEHGSLWRIQSIQGEYFKDLTLS